MKISEYLVPIVTPTFALVALGLWLSQPAQASAQARIDVGIRGGVNLANEMTVTNSTEQALDLSPILRTNVGGELDYWLGDHWATTALLEYDARGTRRNYQSLGFGPAPFSVQNSVHLNYLDAAILIKGQAGSGPLRPYFLFGPMIGYLLSSSTTNSSANDQITEYYKTDIGLLIGLGTSCVIDPNISLLLEANYLQGLTGVAKQSSTEFQTISSTVRFAAGIMFQLKN